MDDDMGRDDEKRAAFGLVAAHAFALDGLDLDAPAKIAAARADLEELADATGSSDVWGRATDSIAMLSGGLLRELARAHGLTVAEELRRWRWGE